MKHVLRLVHEKETKGTHRYTEVEGPGGIVLGTLYVKKAALDAASVPKSLTVTIED